MILATATGLAANLAGLHIPEWIQPTVNRIGAASLALGLMAAGAGMQFSLLQRSKLLTVSVLSIRHLLQPLIAWAIARLLGLDPVQTAVLLAFSALPTASSCYVLAARWATTATYVAGLVTLPPCTQPGQPDAGPGLAGVEQKYYHLYSFLALTV